MAFAQSEVTFQPGLASNRSARASKGRWFDGNLVRFRDGVPAQVGGWQTVLTFGVAILGRARDMLAWRPNSQAGRFLAIGTNSNAYLYDGETTHDITPAGFIPGRPDSIIGNGYGAGNYGRGTYGTPRALSYNVLSAGGWTFDLYGEQLIGCGLGDGTIYEYTVGTDQVMQPVANAPKARAILVSDERHLFAFGAGGNPRLVQWSDRENITVWAPTSANRAGSYEVQSTSEFQCGARARGTVLAWTQTELFAFSPLNNSLVYDRNRLANECGAAGPHSVAVVTDQTGDVVYWMGISSFWIFDGVARKLACDLQDYVFKDVNVIQRAKVQARINAAFGEVWFFYPSGSSDEVDRAVIYNFENSTWSKATIARLAWADAGIFPRPLAIGPTGSIYEHESGDDADGQPMPSFVLSSPVMMGVGQQMAQFLDFWPDMEAGSSPCTLEMIGRYYAGAPDEVFGPYPFDIGTEKIDLALELRQAQVRIAGGSGHWELGTPLLNMQSGGLR